MGNYGTYIILGVFIVIFIVMTVVSNKQRKKQAQQEQEKKDSLCAGAKVITIGGIVGKVISVDNKNSTFVLQTGESKIELDKRAIYQLELPNGAKKAEPANSVVDDEEKPAKKSKAQKSTLEEDKATE